MMSKKGRHVVPSPKGGWAVRKSGSERATRVFGTQEEAIKFARNLAKKEHAEFYLHRKDGTIRKRDSYSADSFPSKG